MEGPTPVSALIHARYDGDRRVCSSSAGVRRCSSLRPKALVFVTFIGATTAFFAASVGLFQNDIKRVIAYSTCSQLGYMFASAGVSAYGSAMFHLFTHAFFKALLFLGAGAVIHSMHHEQDMRRMGGLARQIPFTWTMMLIGNLALTGFGIPLLGIGTAGFYSKDGIINATFNAGTPIGTYAFIMTVTAALMTSFYSWRQFLMTFHGRYRGLDHHHAHDEHDEPGEHHAPALEDVHESPWTMLVPLFLLAAERVVRGRDLRFLFRGRKGGRCVLARWHGCRRPLAITRKASRRYGCSLRRLSSRSSASESPITITFSIRNCPRRWPRAAGCSTNSSTTNGISMSCTISCLCGPRNALAVCCGR